MREHVRLQKDKANTWTFTNMDEKMIRGFIFERGLTGTSNRDLMREIYEEMQFGNNEIALKDKLNVRTFTASIELINSYMSFYECTYLCFPVTDIILYRQRSAT